MVIFTWFSLTDSHVGHVCRSCYIARFSYNTVWRCRFWNTFWLLHKQSHGTIPHTYRRNQSKFIFNKSSAKKWPHYGKSTVVFFTVKLDATNSFPSNTTEVRPIYLKMGRIMRKPALSYVNNKGADQLAHPCSLISAFLFAAWIHVVTSCYSSKLYSAIGTYCTLYLQPVNLRKASFVTCTSFTLQERCYTDSVSLCRFFCDKSFW